MTTPQNELYRLSDRIKGLTEMFEVDEGETSIFDEVKLLYIEHCDIVKRLDMLQDQLTLIIKLLSKDVPS